jgi:hypothetical protein
MHRWPVAGTQQPTDLPLQIAALFRTANCLSYLFHDAAMNYGMPFMQMVNKAGQVTQPNVASVRYATLFLLRKASVLIPAPLCAQHRDHGERGQPAGVRRPGGHL